MKIRLALRARAGVASGFEGLRIPASSVAGRAHQRSRSCEIILLRALIVLGFVVAASVPAGAKELDPIDYKAYYEVLPRMRELSEASHDQIFLFNRLMNELLQTKDDNAATEIRAKLRPALMKHVSMKEEMVSLVDKALVKPAPVRSDLDAYRALRETNLQRVNWQGTFLKHVIRDISQGIGVPFRLNNRVQELNQVEISFREVNAESVLDLICGNFDLKWVIYGGEFIILKKVRLNEYRFQLWEEKYGPVDWISEAEAKSAQDIEIKTPKRELKKVEDMDLPLLKLNLTKMYVLEGASKLNETRLEQFEIMSKIVNPYEERDNTPEEQAAMVKRHKHILHYLYMERENNIEVWDILNRVLGNRLELPNENQELQRILETEVPRVEWKDMELMDALFEVGQLLGCGVEADLPPRTELRVDLFVENVTGKVLLDLLCEIQPLTWRFEGGRLYFVHRDK